MLGPQSWIPRAALRATSWGEGCHRIHRKGDVMSQRLHGHGSLGQLPSRAALLAILQALGTVTRPAPVSRAVAEGQWPAPSVRGKACGRLDRFRAAPSHPRQGAPSAPTLCQTSEWGQGLRMDRRTGSEAHAGGSQAPRIYPEEITKASLKRQVADASRSVSMTPKNQNASNAAQRGV